MLVEPAANIARLVKQDLETGAGLAISRPFSAVVLVARLRTRLRRVQQKKEDKR